MNLAIVGCGWGGSLQMEVGFSQLPELFRPLVCCDCAPERAAAFAERHGFARSASELAEVLRIDDVDVVSICTPPGSHFDMVMAALAAGRHVICEKPFTSSLALIDRVIEAQRSARARVMPIFQYRFGPGLARIRHLVRSGLAGKAYVSAIDTAWQRGPDYYQVPWRGRFATELGGVLVTQAIHIHDLFLHVMGPVAEVAAFKTTRVNPIEVEDCAVASLVMADGSLASLNATLGSLRPVTRMHLCFEHATIERQAFDADAVKPAAEPWSVVPATPELGRLMTAKMAEVPETRTFFARQFELFHEAIRHGRPFPVTLEDARRALELITAIYHASETREAVRLPLSTDHPRYAGWASA